MTRTKSSFGHRLAVYTFSLGIVRARTASQLFASLVPPDLSDTVLTNSCVFRATFLRTRQAPKEKATFVRVGVYPLLSRTT